MRWWLPLLLLCGCDYIFDIAEVPDAAAYTCQSDTFDGTSISQYWEKFEELPTLKVSQNDELVIDLTAAASSPESGEAGVRTANTFDFTQGRVTVELTQDVGGTEFHIEDYLSVFLDYEHAYAFETSTGLLQVATVLGTSHTKDFKRDYDPVAHRFLRIESNAGLLSFQTSADGTTYFTQKELATAFELIGVRIRLVAGTFGGGEPTPGIAKFDSYELCVPSS